MENAFKNNIEYVGLDYKKEIIKIVLINFVTILAFILIYIKLKQTPIIFILLLMLALYDYFKISYFSNYRKQLIKERENEFIQLISYFEVYVTNHINVYQCFKKLIPYSSKWMETEITKFLQEIDKDKSVKPFINFAKKFKAPVIENIMISIYQMIDSGESKEQLNQFNLFFFQLEKAHQKEMIDAMERSLSGVDSYPLFGVAGITLLITVSILSMIGDLINVL